MTRRSLMGAILIGAFCGVGVVVGMTGLSGRTLFGADGGAGGAPTETSAVGSDASPRATDGSPDTRTASTAELSAEPAAQSTNRPIAAKLGRPADSGAYRATTPVASLGDYITWRLIVDPAEAGKTFGVEIGVRLDGTWTAWTKLTSRVADSRGVVVFSWRQRTPAWIRVRFVLPTGPSMGLQGRWR